MPAAIWADTIHLVGEFNNWNKAATPLQLSDHGWSVTLELEAGKPYRYRYLVNNSEWHNDWNADQYQPNEYGGDDSVVITPVFQPPVAVPTARRTRALALGETKPAHTARQQAQFALVQ
jgi:1,4-alpha-glucan branching enzyme